jgi:hypothetical protein
MSTRWTENDIPWLLDTAENLKLHGYTKIANIPLEEISKDNMEG